MRNKRIDNIQRVIEPLRQDIIHHKVYAAIEQLDDLRVFMEHHVFAVWDFMSLLKALQTKLTCTSVPWFPIGSAETRYLINEIVAGEESDVDKDGTRKSHFELYLDAMRQCGANTKPIETFVAVLQETGDFDRAFTESAAPQAARDFVTFTFNTIASNQAHRQSAVFTFGREDLIPGMFMAIINDLYRKFPDTLSIFTYYLERHIEVDGDHHSQLALQMTANLCGENEQHWQEAEQSVCQALQQRMNLWDGVYQKIRQPRLVDGNQSVAAGMDTSV